MLGFFKECWKKMPDWPRPLAERSELGAILQLTLTFIFVFVLFSPLSIITSLFLFKISYITGFLIPLVYLLSIFAFLHGRRNKGIKRFRAWKIAQKLLFVPVIVLAAEFLFVFICFICSVLLNLTLPSTELKFPLSGAEALSIDSNGNVFCYSKYYRRVQLFDRNGTFIRSWFVDIPPSSFTFNIDSRDYLYVALETGVGRYYDPNGRLIEKVVVSDEKFYEHYSYDSNFRAIDSELNTYEIVNRYFLTRIRKTDRAGISQTFVEDEFGIWLLSMPYPGVIFLMCTLLFIGRLNRKLEGRSKIWSLRVLMSNIFKATLRRKDY